MYKCNICCKIFNRKFNYDRHKNRKTQCLSKVSKKSPKSLPKNVEKNTKAANNIVSNALPNFAITKCNFCAKTFKYKKNIGRHLNTCKVKRQLEQEKETIYNALLEKVSNLEKNNYDMQKSNQEIKESYLKMQKENKKLQITIKKLTTVNNVINNNTINSNNNEVIYNIKLVAYGKEDRTKLNQKDILKALQGFGTEVALTKLIHFNDKLPEYHNVYINNMKDKYAMIYNGDKWILKLKTNIIDDIYDTNKEYVEENLDEFIKSLNRSQINALNRWLATEETDEKILQIKEEIKMLLYNEKNIVVKSSNFSLTYE